MFEKLEITRMAQAMASNAGDRMGQIARNVANADTPGFKAMEVASFAEVFREAGHLAMKTTQPGHFGLTEKTARAQPRHSPGSGSPNGNTVSLEKEMVKAAGVRQDHEMALAIYRSTSDIIRASLGRSR